MNPVRTMYAAASDVVENRRREHRRRVLKEARIILNGGFSIIDAMVRDVSPSGCRLRLHHTIRLPQDFQVSFPSIGVERPARLVWQRGRDAGVRFLDPQAPEAFMRLIPG